MARAKNSFTVFKLICKLEETDVNIMILAVKNFMKSNSANDNHIEGLSVYGNCAKLQSRPNISKTCHASFFPLVNDEKMPKVYTKNKFIVASNLK